MNFSAPSKSFKNSHSLTAKNTCTRRRKPENLFFAKVRKVRCSTSTSELIHLSLHLIQRRRALAPDSESRLIRSKKSTGFSKHTLRAWAADRFQPKILATPVRQWQ